MFSFMWDDILQWWTTCQHLASIYIYKVKWLTVISPEHWQTGPSWPKVIIPHRSVEKRKQRTNLQASSHSTLFKDKDSYSCSGIYNGWRDTAKCKHPPIQVAVPLIKQEVCKEDRGTGMSSNSCEPTVKEHQATNTSIIMYGLNFCRSKQMPQPLQSPVGISIHAQAFKLM